MTQLIHARCFTHPVRVITDQKPFIVRYCPCCRTDVEISQLVTISDDLEYPIGWNNPNPATEI